MSGVDSKRFNNAGSVWLGAACAIIGLFGLLLEKSFLVGKRGFAFTEGSEAQIIGCFWLLLSAAFLAALVPNLAVRKRIYAVIVILMVGGLLGIFGYIIYFMR